MKGVWMWPDSIIRHGAEKCVSYISRAGITDIFFLTKGLSGKTSYQGVFAPSVSERDLLKELIHASHKSSIRVHAWFTSACDEHYKSLFPSSGRCHFSRGRDRELITITDEDYIAYMENIVREVTSNYDIDGLHLDYIRYNHILYGWSDEEISQYESEGADISRLRELVSKTFYTKEDENAIFDAFRNGDASAHAFSLVRRKNVNAFAGRLTQAAKEIKPGLSLSCSLMPEGAYDDKAFSDLHYGQNYSDLSGIFSLALPMAYSKAYDKNSEWVKDVYEKTAAFGFRTLTGLHAYQGGTSASLKGDIKALSEAGTNDYCLFREGAFAYAFCLGAFVSIYNPTEKRIRLIQDSAQVSELSTEPGEEITFRPSADFRCIYDDGTEVPVHTVSAESVSSFSALQVRRISEMEEIFTSITHAFMNLSASFTDFRNAEKDLKSLLSYYENGCWLKDYSDDEEGKLPAVLRRGVLSLDCIDSLFCGIRTLKNEIKAFLNESVLE